MKWYYAHGGSQKGPINGDELRAKLAAGEVAKTDLVWREGMKDWVPASEVGELSTYAPDGPKPEAVSEPPSAPAEQGVAPVSPAQQQTSVAPSQSAPVSPYQAPQSPQGGVPQGAIPNYLWQSIVVTVLCCLPFGIPAIVYAAKVDSLVAQGRYAEAQEASKNAKLWTWVSFGCGLAIPVIYFFIFIIAALGSAGNM